MMIAKTPGPNDILTDDNYFISKFNAQMTLLRKVLLGQSLSKCKASACRSWARVGNATGYIAVEGRRYEGSGCASHNTLPSLPIYGSRECTTAMEAWELLETFLAKRNLHNRVQLCKQLTSLRCRAVQISWITC
ncbi:hypothetical protein Plhal304r1_c049g0130811 [Plasmopara halstedii]